MLVFPPFHRFFIHHPEELGLPFSLARFETAAVGRGGRDRSGLCWHGRVRWLARRAVQPSQYLLFSRVIPLHWLTFAFLSWQAAVPP